jgi:signal transduction histidine kinase
MAKVVLPRAKESALIQQRMLREYFAAKTHIKINIRPVALNDLLSELDNRFSTRKTHDIEIKVGQGIPENLSTDMDRLVDVILELVTNAEKYSPEGSKITVGFEKKELDFNGMKILKISVSDQGMGIEKDQLHRLFHERNLRLSPGIANGNSSGNGLHVCGRIVAKLGGDIAVDSEKGNGSTFTITLRTS